ncbi:hypothetical protein C1B77_22645 [Salmonella enterica]|nr:hypothetical protein [Salmonella enterica]
MLTLLMSFPPTTRAAWTYECTLKDGNISVSGRTFTIPASGSGTLWVGETTINKSRISRTADSQSGSLAAYLNDDVIKNATGTSFARVFVNRGDGGLSYISFWLDPDRLTGASAVTACVYSTPGFISNGKCPANYTNDVIITEIKGVQQTLMTQLYNTLSLNGVDSNNPTSLDFPVAPPNEFQDHTITWGLGPVTYIQGYTGSLSIQGDVTTSSGPPWPSVICTRKATPVKFILTPDTIDFASVPAGSSQILTRSLNFSLVTAPAIQPSATLTFSHADADDGKLVLNGGKVSFQRVSDGLSVRLNESFAVTEKNMDFTVFLDASTARAGQASTDVLVTLTLN